MNTVFSNTDIKAPIDYNYPPMNRKDLIKNKPLNSSDFRMRKFKQIDTNRKYSFNNYALDIEGACPKRYGFYSLKPDYSIQCNDIEKTCPRKTDNYLDRPIYCNSNMDIELSSPQKLRHFSTSRHVNPLSPDYPLPTVNPTIETPYVPKFLRDNIDISDIDGTKSKTRHHKFIRDNMLTFSAEEAIKRKVIDKRGIYNSIDYSDVSQKQGLWNRCVNPLDPVYDMKYFGGENYVHGEIEGSKPCSFSRYDNSGICTNLKTEDIEGAQSNTLSAQSKWKNKHNGNPMTYSMPVIEGSNTGTVYRGIRTNRCLNPLKPQYQFLDNYGEDCTQETKKVPNRRYHIETEGQKNNDVNPIELTRTVLSEGNQYDKNDRVNGNKGPLYEPNDIIEPINEENNEDDRKHNKKNEAYAQTEMNEISKSIDYYSNNEASLQHFLANNKVDKIPSQNLPYFNPNHYIIKQPYHGVPRDQLLIPTNPTIKPRHPFLQYNSKLPTSPNINVLSQAKPFEYQLDSLIKGKHY